MKRIYDAVVLGAGIAGTCAAKDLADKGWDTLLIDRKEFPRHKVCGEFLSPEFQGMLGEIGLYKVVESLQPALIDRARLTLSKGDSLEVMLPNKAWGISRYVLDAALHHAAQQAGVQLRTGVTVMSVAPAQDGFLIETRRDGEREYFHARTVIGAMGVHRQQQDRKLLEMHNGRKKQSMNKEKSAYLGVKSHYTDVSLDSAVELYFFPGGYLGLSPLPGGEVNAAALVDQKAFSGSEGDKSVLGIIKEAARHNQKLGDKLKRAIPVAGSQSAVSPVKLNRKPLAWDEYALIGDAAVMIPPLCGDGMSMALRSARICTPLADLYLKGAISRETWQLEYAASLKREFSGPLRYGHWIQSLGELPILSKAVLAVAKLVPSMGAGLLQATRLKDNRL
ncbi:FAD-dependent oxidoreductase [Paenibacillus baekrokdamisoli]|uniref:FAD-dependent oxidoreductase n=1 Tax=Paenibacillus baekrokdamisoli TaxID=1712516 RepID=A0A3G9IY26_9BACL|nr:FAD-dependent monooxygenase [Paenibacillus baekrokdamisoli]MBB3068985.1 flavin-dependent dehydrogenase [Paenibacillus baekrokdamisoli]BBH23807.1 FAD-dependent oxidoreductase [Paenibacillus baekrokdamisoli]